MHVSHLEGPARVPLRVRRVRDSVDRSLPASPSLRVPDHPGRAIDARQRRACRCRRQNRARLSPCSGLPLSLSPSLFSSASYDPVAHSTRASRLRPSPPLARLSPRRPRRRRPWVPRAARRRRPHIYPHTPACLAAPPPRLPTRQAEPAARPPAPCRSPQRTWASAAPSFASVFSGGVPWFPVRRRPHCPRARAARPVCPGVIRGRPPLPPFVPPRCRCVSRPPLRPRIVPELPSR